MPKTVVWTEEEAQMFCNLKKAGKCYHEIGEILYKCYGHSRSRDSLKHKWKRTNWVNLTKNRENNHKILTKLMP